VWEPTPTPPPGWRSLVSDLLLGDDAFPEGWARIRDLPKGSLTDPTVNHVYRSWWNAAQGVGKTDQAIWRSYTIEDAIHQYTELRQQGMLLPNYTPSPWDFFVEFKPPPEIDFRSQIADQFYLACGWLYGAQCHVIARYHNYVTYASLDLEAEYEGHIDHGLTYPEVDTVVRAMDAKFAEALEKFSALAP
jgi:hypothetical protein